MSGDVEHGEDHGEPEARKPAAVKIPRFVIDDFLLGRVRPDVLQRFIPSADVVSDVWGALAKKDLRTPVRVLIAPVDGVSAVEVGAVLSRCLDEYRRSDEAKSIDSWRKSGDTRSPEKSDVDVRRQASNISPLEGFVAITLYWDELFRIVLPLTRWWSAKNIGILSRKKPARQAKLARELLEAEIVDSLIHDETPPPPGNEQQLEKVDKEIRRVVEATPYASLIGLFVLVASHPEIGATFCKWDETARGSEAKNEELRKWLGRSKAAAEKSKAKEVARAAVQELQRKLPDSVLRPQGLLGEASKRAAEAADPDSANPPALIRRVFLDRKATLAAEEGVCTIKADAASRLFNVSCRDITWAIIDSGIATKHPAFVDHQTAAEGGVASNGTSRVRAILDFTLIEKIRSFDLIADGYKGKERDKAIAEVIEQLHGLPDEPELENFDEVAKEKLQLIAAQLEAHLQPDWNLIEPLIRRKPGKGDPKLVSGHGTHVAGILGADWREQDNGTEKKILEGVCPDINFHDLRVINHRSRESTEFAILAALEYVQFANRRTSGMQQVIQGVNISLSIPHEVRNYACGATPVCVACDSLVGSGVVVVAAAGNRGWNEQELGFGSFVFCSITDPGNAQDVITVGATHRLKPHTYGVSFFSSRGPTGDGRNKPDLVAPGENIKGPVLGDTDDELDGTSMAAPFVSGAAAMLIARHGELYGRPQRIKEILCRSATDLGREKYFQGHGLVDVLRAIQSV